MQILHEEGCNTEIAKMSLALATRDVDFVKFCRGLDIPIENEDWNCADEEEVTILLEQLNIDPFESQYGIHGYEDSPFMYIAQEGRPEILDILVDKHPCLGKYGEEDKKEKMNLALHRAVRFKRLDNALFFLDKMDCDVEAKDANDRTLFQCACDSDEEIAFLLIERGADVNIVDVEGLTALHWSAHVGHSSLCRVLVEKGCEVNAQAKLGATPLMVACAGAHHDIVELLIERGADINMVTPEGWSALHVSVWASAPSIVRVLLGNGADPDVQSYRLTHKGDKVPASTPLLIAIFLNSIKIVRHLLDANVNVDLWGLTRKESKEEEIITQTLSPVQYAIVSRAWDLVELLVKVGCKYDTILDWLDREKSTIPIPEEKHRRLRKLLRMYHSEPVPLKDLACRIVRKKLGQHLTDKVEKLPIPNDIKDVVLLQDLFQSPESDGSFEV